MILPPGYRRSEGSAARPTELVLLGARPFRVPSPLSLASHHAALRDIERGAYEFFGVRMSVAYLL